MRGLTDLRASLIPFRREEIAVRDELVSLIADLTNELARAAATGTRVDSGRRRPPGPLTGVGNRGSFDTWI